MNTQEIIKRLHIIVGNRTIAGIPTDELTAATDRLYELQFLVERKEMHSKEWEDQAREARKERDEARTLNQELITKLNHALAELHHARANTRPEPSRLKIAARLMAANLSRETEQWETVEEAVWAVEQADALIAAAKEAK